MKTSIMLKNGTSILNSKLEVRVMRQSGVIKLSGEDRIENLGHIHAYFKLKHSNFILP